MTPRPVRHGLLYAVLPRALTDVDHPHQLRPVVYPAGLVWHPDDPHAVELRLNTRVTWTAALSLLVHGLDGPAGLGDVFVCPVPGHRLEVVLESPNGHIAVQVDTVAVRRFVEDVAAVWAPVEVADDELAAWIARAAW